MEQNIKISVRSLVEFILRSGDIDNRRGTMSDKDAMQMGSRLHRKIQGRMGSDYQAEVFLSETFDCENFTITVEGRADGIIQGEDLITVDEIKGILRDLSLVERPVEVHLAQAKCYAYLYAFQKGLSQIAVQMTYCNLETEEMRKFQEVYGFEELEQWFLQVLNEYKKWARFQIEWRQIRQNSAKQLTFPFAYREGQKDLAAAVYRTIARKKQLFIQAPTGAGKTVSTVFPAIKAVGEGLGDKIFYLTAKTIARTVAEDTFSLLKEQGLRYKVLTITAKEKICCQETPECNPLACPRAKGHYDRVNDAVYEMITTQECFDRDAIMAQAEAWQVCPFEMSLDVSLWVDAIICDYNYVFDPRARLKRFFAEGAKGEYLFLIDEAHNLVERGRDMFSAKLQKEDFLELKKALLAGRSRGEAELADVSQSNGAMALQVSGTGRRKSNRRLSDEEKLVRALERCNKNMLELKRECENYQLLESVGMFPISLMNLCGIVEKYLENSRNQELNEKILELYFQVRSFLDICDCLDDHYVIYTELDSGGRFKLKLYCVDPSAQLQECLDKGNSAIFFSATLLPVDYYKSLLSTKPDDYAIYAESCFDVAKKQILIGQDTSSRYTSRGIEQYKRMAGYVKQTVAARKGNYLVFFSSYKMMEEVADCFEAVKEADMEILRQESGMTEAKREEFLEQFSEDNAGSLVGFCVMGSIFGEGIDLKYDRLIGAIIVGTGLPQVCNEREILKEYYNVRNKDGFRYAYLCPGMNKVLQAAGRVIRTEEDEGVILLLDERFTKYQYQSMFPREWVGSKTCTLQNIGEKLTQFWELRQEK